MQLTGLDLRFGLPAWGAISFSSRFSLPRRSGFSQSSRRLSCKCWKNGDALLRAASGNQGRYFLHVLVVSSAYLIQCWQLAVVYEMYSLTFPPSRRMGA